MKLLLLLLLINTLGCPISPRAFGEVRWQVSRPGAGATHPSSATLDSIRKAGALTCGINQSEPEYSLADQHGPRVAFDRELCRAVAAAILGPNPRIILKGFPDNDTALAALRAHEVDLVPTVSDDFTHATASGITLSRPALIDAQSFLVLRASAIAKPQDLAGKKICFLTGSEAETDLHAWFNRHHLTFVPFPFQEEGEMEAAFVTNNCAALSGDLTRLANTRVAFAGRASEYTFLPEAIALDPLAMASRADDPVFANLLNATLSILLTAEELGVSQPRIPVLASSKSPAIARLLGQSHELAAPLSLDPLWPTHVLEATGNYAEIYARTLGHNSPLQLPRGLNSLWNQGGLLFATPLE
jgi:general L-amino acid transport system substrate-binding protein